MSKDKKNIENNLIRIFKTIFTILLLAISMYIIMAIITHFSLNYNNENYKFTQSLLSIFNSDTAIFKFFFAFVILNVSWILVAVMINFIKNKL